METFDSVFAAGIHQNGGADNVGVQENLRIFDGAVYVGLGSKVDDDVRMFLLEQLIDTFAVRDIFLHKTEIRVVHDRSKRGQVAGIGQAVQTYDSVIRIFFSACRK